MAARCQVCDGPIVNGRCKLCGMPYRRDEELYHLNEDRSEHYRHANARIRQKMREQDTPILDRMQSRSSGQQTQNSRTVAQQRSGRQTQSRTGTQQRSGQQTQSRVGTQQRSSQQTQSRTGTRRTTQWTQYGVGTQRTTQRTTGQTMPPKKKGGSKFLLIIVIFMVVSILSGIYSAWEEERNSFTWSWEDDEENDYDWEDDDADSDDWDSEDDSDIDGSDADGSDRYYMSASDAAEIIDAEEPLLQLECGEEEEPAFEEGTYLAHIEDGFGVLVIEEGNSISSKTLSRYSNNYVFSADGDETFRLTGSGGSSAYVEFYQID